MKRLSLISCLILLFFASCSNVETPYMSVDQESFTAIDYDGGTYQVKVSSNNIWSVESDHSWCKVDKPQGDGDGVLEIIVDPNITASARTATVTLSASDNTTHQIRVAQLQGGPDIVNYRIPVIFHVLYGTSTNEVQNIPAKKINDALAGANLRFAGAFPSSRNMKVQFVLATKDPKGRLLPEPGIERIQTKTPEKSLSDFYENPSKEDLEMLWPMDQYINIFVYTINDGYAGLGAFPYTVAPDFLVGLNEPLDFWPKTSDIGYMHAVHISNTNFTYTDPVEDEIISSAGPSSVIAHELGHYLGLRHVFSESETHKEVTDGCTDTHTYDRDAYNNLLENFFNTHPSFGYEDLLPLLKRVDSVTSEEYTSYNIMDYDLGWFARFTPDQYARTRYILLHSPLIPGPKLSQLSRAALQGTPRTLYQRVYEKPRHLPNIPIRKK